MIRGGAVYILTNKSYSTLYVGVTSDLKKRIWEHKNFIHPESFTAKDGKSYSLKRTGGGVTLRPWESTTGNTQIFVHPESGKIAAAMPGGSNLYYGSGDLIFTNDMGDAHEFGHAHNILFPYFVVTRHPFRPETRIDGPYTVFENAVRSRYPSRKRRFDSH